MRKSLIGLFILLLWVSLFPFHSEITSVKKAEDFLGVGQYLGEYWPTKEWRTCRPEEVGMDSGQLMKVYEYASNPHIQSQGIAVIRKGYIVGEAYFGGFTQDTKHESFSVAKSFSSALIGIAIEKGLIRSVDEKVAKFYPEWQKPGTPEAQKRITIRDLLTMSSGLEWNEKDYYQDRSQNDVYKMIKSSDDYIQYALDKPIIHEPGEHWYYSSGDSILFSGIIEKSANMCASEFAFKHLFEPLGLTDVVWLSDPAGHTITAWGIQATVRELAKFGYLYLKKGQWEDRQIVPEHWVEESVSPASESVKKYGYQWWLLPALKGYEESDIPSNTFLAWGIYTQQIFVIPEKNLLIVRLGNDANPAEDEWVEVELLTLVLNSLNE